MAMFALGVWNVGASPVFGAHNLELSGARFTSRAEVEALIGLDNAPNLFRFAADRLAQQLVTLPAVETAKVDVRLPSTIVVAIVEREPRLDWVIGNRRYVVDQDGLLFGLVDDAGNAIPSDAGPLRPTPSPSASPSASPTPQATASASASGSTGPSSPAASSKPLADAASLAPVPTPNPGTTAGPQALSLPVVFDRRAVSAKWSLGSRVDAVNLDAGYRLGGLTPAEVGTTARGLTVVLDDDHGFTVSPTPAKWVAEFGFYTPTRRKDTVIPTQVRDLGLLLAKWGEDGCAWIWLVADISDAHSNSCLPR
ncbi:MAG TPA: FtsQ-type POTRA domain-containing protein [Candidatus Limnocylindrales bacterium]